MDPHFLWFHVHLMTHFPEGAELYEWRQVPEENQSVLFHRGVMDCPFVFGAPLEELPPPEVIEVKRTHGPYGWNEELRVGVIFGPHPPPNFDSSQFSDADLHLLADEGQDLLYGVPSDVATELEWIMAILRLLFRRRGKDGD